MRRYEGFLRHRESEPLWPSRWWVVAVQLSSAGHTSTGGLRRSTLERWTADVLDCDGPTVTNRVRVSSNTADSFWSCFLSQGQVKGTLYALSPRALMAWQLLGVWERIECGELQVPGHSDGVRTTGNSRKVCGVAGLLLTNDPPTAGGFKHEQANISWTWVCAGNYGLQPATCGTDSDVEAAQLADAVSQSNSLLYRYNLGGWGVTAGAIALKGWLSTYEGKSIYVSSGPNGDALENSAVAGGLLLARPTGDRPVTGYCVDARSMYPFIASSYPQGVALIRRNVRGVDARRLVAENPLACLARVEIETPEPYYPQRTDRGVIYPAGRFMATLCGPELEEALRRNHVRSIICCHEYDLGLPTAAYQRRVWAARQECATGIAAGAAGLVKRLGVSLVGKLFQRREIWHEVIPDICDPLWGSWEHLEWDGQRRHYQARAGITECCLGHELCSHAIPSIPLWVWSWGRIRLWRWLLTAGQTEVLYADTDGLLLTETGYARLTSTLSLSDSSWGMLRHVSGPEQCTVIGPKQFTMGERVVCAGVPRNERQSASQIGQRAWYRLPWDHMNDPGCNSSWVERVR